MKKTFLLVLTCAVIITAQQNADTYSLAFDAYNNQNYSLALKLFTELKHENDLDESILAAASFYSADCLLNLDQNDGAVIELEMLADKFRSSNFRSAALYKLGTIYYIKREYRKCRDRLLALVREYPFSEFHGSAYYWIGEAFSAENKFLDGEENFREAISNKKTNRYLENSIYSLAQLYEKTGDYTSAVTNYDELLTYYKQSPLAPKAQMRIGICYFNLRDYDNAILELTDSEIKLLPAEELNEAKFFLGNCHARLKEYGEASKIFGELMLNSQDEQFLNRVAFSNAWVNFQLGKYEEAFNDYKTLSQTATDSIKILSLFWSGECKRYAGDTKSSETIFKEFINKYPEHRLSAKAQLGRGAVFVAQSNSADAESALMNATLSLDKQTKVKAYTMLGETRLNAKRYEDARKYFNEAIRLKPDQIDLRNRALLGLGVSLFFLSDLENAEINLGELKKNSKDFENDKVNFYMAEIYFARGKYSPALKNYNAVKSSNDLLVKQTIIGKAYSYFNLKDFSNAISQFNDYITKHKDDSKINDIKLRLADSYFGAKSFDKAAAIYKDLFSKEKNALDNDHAFYQYGQALFKAGKTEEAKNTFEQLQKKFPRSKYLDESQYVIGWIDFQQNNFVSAIQSYKMLIDRYPHSELVPVALYSIGDAYFNEANYDSSITFYSSVLERFPNTKYIFDAVNGIQYSYVAKEQPENAISFIDDFIAKNPSSKYSDQIFFKKGDLYYSIAKYDLAVKAYREFSTNYSSSPLVANAYYWIAKSLVNLKKDSDAISNYVMARQKSLKTEIGISSTIELSKLYSTKKQYEESSKVLEECIAANATSNRISELLYMKGENLIAAGKQDDALNTFEQIVSYEEGSLFAVKAKVTMGKIEVQRNNFDKAQNLLKDIGEKRVDDIGAEAQYYYGLSLYNQNNIPEAITAFVRTRSIFAGYDEWYTKSIMKLGDCFAKMNDKKQAKEMYRAVISKHPDDEYTIEAKKKLRGL
jgi:TolA-binding protein